MGITEKMIDLDLREQSAWRKSENILSFLCETLVFTEAVLGPWSLVCSVGGTYRGDVSRWSQLIGSNNKHFTFINLRVTSFK